MLSALVWGFLGFDGTAGSLVWGFLMFGVADGKSGPMLPALVWGFLMFGVADGADLRRRRIIRGISRPRAISESWQSGMVDKFDCERGTDFLLVPSRECAWQICRALRLAQGRGFRPIAAVR
jgi:hypothetical protein